jgi:tetratricopeptide (TPR) repeat protein
VEWYVDLLRHEGKEDQVEPFLAQATVSFASDVPKRLLVEQYLAKGNLHGALALCEQICCFLDSDAPKDDRLEYYKLGAQICAQMQDDQKALYWYRSRSYLLREDQLLVSQVEAPLDAIKRCSMRAIEERDFVTISLYNELHECISKDISLLMKLGTAYSKSSRQADSIKVFNDVLSIDPSQPEALRSLAYTHNLYGRFGESEKFYTEYLKYRPHDPSALLNRGSVRLSLGWRSIPGALIDFFSAIRFRNTSKSG